MFDEKVIGAHGVSAVALVYVRERDLPAPKLLDIPSISALPGIGSLPAQIDQAAHSLVKQSLQETSKPPDAVITGMDLRAPGVYRALRETGLRPGHDIAVMGYDDVWLAGMLHPPLTTIHQPTDEMGRTAADLLIDRLEGAIRQPRRISLDPELIARDSTLLWSTIRAS
ncbi:MAG: substrate-binding domain-containing protein [Candidatus Pacebacteria bacterium]|nr:substrate-binding domain-containing protein [Candidatus Paceibacterota bacterium]